ncbi:hypothetical protein ACQCSV_13500 [Pseudarthrobacter sp. S3]|uniref:hypothetical protein n=1 Tax=Pseudarthrobacter sp. S3 TaxID=3418419 RepID=UPI003CF4E297
MSEPHTFLSGHTLFALLPSQQTAAYEQAFSNDDHVRILLLLRFAPEPLGAMEIFAVTGVEQIYWRLTELRRLNVVSAEQFKPVSQRKRKVYFLSPAHALSFDLHFEAHGGTIPSTAFQVGD